MSCLEVRYPNKYESMRLESLIAPYAGNRRKGTSYEELKNLFVNNITTKHIYEPLMSCRLNDDASEVKRELNKMDFDAAGVVDGGQKEVHRQQHGRLLPGIYLPAYGSVLRRRYCRE